MCQQLLPLEKAYIMAFHPITGCDVASHPAGILKVKGWHTFKNHAAPLSSLSNVPFTAKALESAEEFLVKVYNIPDVNNCNAARHAILEKVSLRRLPQTIDAVRFRIMGAHYQTAVWEMANIPDMVLPAATELGWRLDGNILILILTTLQPIPKACAGFVTYLCKKNTCSTNKCRCWKVLLPCTNMFVCSNDYNNLT